MVRVGRKVVDFALASLADGYHFRDLTKMIIRIDFLRLARFDGARNGTLEIFPTSITEEWHQLACEPYLHLLSLLALDVLRNAVQRAFVLDYAISVHVVILSNMLFYGVGHWNSWFNAVIYMRTRTKFPLQLILREILIENEQENMTTNVGSLDKEPIGETIKYATIVVATVPILCIYPFLQKYFAKGVMVGAVKE